MKMLMSLSALVLMMSTFVAGQRPFFAGSRPIGFPGTPNRTTTTPDPLGNRFGDGTPERLPIEANGDRDLIDRLSKLPIDKQPFWFINWQALEAHRKKPQTYPQRPNVFVDPIPQNSNTGTVDNRFSTPNPGLTSTNAVDTNTGIVNDRLSTLNPDLMSTNPVNQLANRFAPTTVPNLDNANANSKPNLELANRNSGSLQNTNYFGQQNFETYKNPVVRTQTDTNPTVTGHEYF